MNVQVVTQDEPPAFPNTNKKLLLIQKEKNVKRNQ
jgi:hypothetical protein